MEQPQPGQENEPYRDSEDILELERHVAALDAQIVELVQRRAAVTRTIAELRWANGDIAFPHSEVLKDSARWPDAELGAAIVKICMGPPGR